MWMLSNVANFISQMMMVVILYSFGKKSEKKKSDTPPESPVDEKTISEQIDSVERSKNHDDSSNLSYTLLDTYKNTVSSLN
jgi:hypothetical protein